MLKLNFSVSFYFKFWAKIDILAILATLMVQIGAGRGSPQKGVYLFLI